jgi:heptosyltransferase-3
MGDPRKILILQAHNLGDAVISTALVETIARDLPNAQIDVVTRPEIRQIFSSSPFVHNVFTAHFPMGSMGDFGIVEGVRLLRLIVALRLRRYTDVVNLAGDFREEFLGWMISPQNNWTPKWAEDNPCKEVIRRSVIPIANRAVLIPASKPNIYDAASILGSAVCEGPAYQSALYTPNKTHIRWKPQKGLVGIHPMASQPWRRWNLNQWREVADTLISCGLRVQVFGAPSEADELNRHFGDCSSSSLQIVTGSLSDYFVSVSKVELFLCHDSFASHVAYAIGVPIVFLNGANDANAWAPPGASVLAAGLGLPCYPCYNRPTCLGSPAEFACIRNISPDIVVKTVQHILRQGSDVDKNFAQHK